MAAVFTFDEPTHEYRVDGVRLPSVTGIIKPIGPDFSMIPPDVLEAKRAFGTAVHLACELDDAGELDEDGTDARVIACVQAWRKFRADTGAAIVLNERKLYHPTLRFAGTLDRLAYMRLRQEATASTWLLDLKTGIEPHASYGVQLCGYSLLLQTIEAELEARTLPGLRRGTVHLFDDGTYRFHVYKNPNDEATFRACLAITHWLQANT